MTFVSAYFVAFLAVVALLYFVVPKNTRWVVLLVASYCFFFLNSEWLIAVLFAQTVVTYALGRWMCRVDEAMKLPDDASAKDRREAKSAAKKKKHRILVFGVVFNIGIWVFLKYYNFFADSANVLLRLVGVSLPSLGLLVPIGLSFYTLQAVAYLVDLQRGKIEADGSLPKFMLFMSTYYFLRVFGRASDATSCMHRWAC